MGKWIGQWERMADLNQQTTGGTSPTGQPLGNPVHLWSANPAPLCDCLGTGPPDLGPCSQALFALLHQPLSTQHYSFVGSKHRSSSCPTPCYS